MHALCPTQAVCDELEHHVLRHMDMDGDLAAVAAGRAYAVGAVHWDKAPSAPTHPAVSSPGKGAEHTGYMSGACRTSCLV